MAIYRFGQKIKELFIKGRSIAKVYDHGRLVFSKAEEIVYYTLSINPSPSNATVRLTYNGTTTTSKTITVPAGSSVSYTVSATGYTSQSATVVMNSNRNITVTLVKDVSTAKWLCYHYFGNLPMVYGQTNKNLYFYIPPNTTSGLNVGGAGPTVSYDGKDIVFDLVCTAKGSNIHAMYSFGTGGIYRIVSANASTCTICPNNSTETVGNITGTRDTSGDLY